MEVVENIRLWDRLLLLSIEAYFSSPAGIFQEYLGFPMFDIELWILFSLEARVPGYRYHDREWSVHHAEVVIVVPSGSRLLDSWSFGMRAITDS